MGWSNLDHQKKDRHQYDVMLVGALQGNSWFVFA